MRRFFLILAILAAMVAGSACPRKGEQTQGQPEVAQQGTTAPSPKWQVSIVDHWIVEHPSALSRDLIAITLVVRNTAPKDVKVKVVCHFADDGSLFGESIPQTVHASSDAKLMVRGFWRCPNGIKCHESFDCRVEPVK